MKDAEMEGLIVSAAEYLGLGIRQTAEKVWIIDIPDELEDEIGLGKTIKVSAQKVRSEYLDAEPIEQSSFLVQKLSSAIRKRVIPITSYRSQVDFPRLNTEAVRDLAPGVTLGIEESDSRQTRAAIFYIRGTVSGTDTTERLVTVGVDLDSEAVISRDLVEQLEGGIKDEKRIAVEGQKFDRVADIASREGLKALESLVDEKYREMQEELVEELGRVESYYGSLRQESSLATKTASEKTTGLLKDLDEEKANLVEALTKKYSRSSMNLEIAPVGIALVLSELKELRLTLEGRGHIASIPIEVGAGDIDELLSCSVCSRKEKTVRPWNGTIICRECLGVCGVCGGDFLRDELKTCHVCGMNICSECARTSALSGAIYCTQHARECHGCHSLVGQDEIVLCGSCKREFCSQCVSKSCVECHNTVCYQCAVASEVSGAVFCNAHTFACPTCGKTLGGMESPTCQRCGKNYCNQCVKSGVCDACRSLEKVPSTDPRVVMVCNRVGMNPRAKKWKASTLGGAHLLEGKKFGNATVYLLVDASNWEILG